MNYLQDNFEPDSVSKPELDVRLGDSLLLLSLLSLLLLQDNFQPDSVSKPELDVRPFNFDIFTLPF